jgi:hypothetical protein
MITLELTHFDQNAILFLVVSALSLIRERQILPFGVVIIGAIFQGPIVLSLLAALIAWHRMDRAASRWIQLKDLLGVFFMIGASLSTDVLQSFFIFFGTFLIALNPGGGLLGTLPAIVLLRQVHPNPEFLEIGLGFAALYWVVAEVFRFVKSQHEAITLAVLEFVCSAVVLINLRPEADKLLLDSVFVGIGVTLILLSFIQMFWGRVKVAGFWSFQHSGRSALARIFLGGAGLLSRSKRLASDEPLAQNFDFEDSLDGLMFWIFGVSAFVIVFILLAKGGLLNDF